MNKSKFVKVLSIVMLVTFGIVGCSTNSGNTGKVDDKQKTSETSSSVDLSKVTIRVGQTGWSSYESALKAAGLDNTPYKVEYSVFQGGNLCLQAMAADQIDFTGSSETPPVFAAESQNQGGFKIVAVSHASTLLQELVVPKDSNIKSVADLKGKKVGYINSTTAQYFLIKMLEKAGLKWEDIDAKQVSTADGVTALSGGQIDAFASYGNSIIAAHKNGATTLESAQNILSGYFPYEASVTALKDEGKKAAITDYLARLEKANQWKRDNAEAWAKISSKPQGFSEEEGLDTFKKQEAQIKSEVILVDDKVIASQQDLSNVFFSLGLIKNKQDVKGFYSNELNDGLKKALNK
ncbi:MULTISPECIES: ABC transporter substrate-binding protein [unclassified Clostridium]|uniref:ABC transporter substrate-binding protein n=1 Tax=unclassified Clostridium TaxID=2614128 RepID=UPI0002980A4D|nr:MULTISPECIES: ABC transporter substrate-binding protein [unclassified Clostridium]EKQ58121.1 MAG: ABC-type nitrate/sulfonate/bicarbonate transport system, periplasmic component [Clostridium sp. Maddingley MBC34-26]